MGKKNSLSVPKGGKVLAGVTALTTVIAAVGQLIQYAEPLAENYVKPAADKIHDKFNERKEYLDSLISVPKLYFNDSYKTFDVAEADIKRVGLTPSLSIVNANPKYRHCIANQVVYTEPKAGSKLEYGATVDIKYITQEVIDESKRMYEEQESEKERKSADDKKKPRKFPFIGKKEEQ